ncbi:hypothetical protein JOF56_000360 [Kibdelosporangium banguiense]|uniref:Uncharacterized protein n=1 Tax=Kibdelosporangium banguiense TaxID=1365924 RepID=A0ABS4T6B1_9PSEU|nr:hypothetical protein [Kibdelosporangium banguiense]
MKTSIPALIPSRPLSQMNAGNAKT